MSKLGVWIEFKLINYAWGRKWLAKRSRKRIAKQSVLAGEQEDGIESYVPTAVIEEQNKRYEKLIETRMLQVEIAQREHDQYEADYAIAKAEAGANPARTEQIFEENKDKKFRYPYTREFALLEHIELIIERIQNERDTKKS